MVVKNKIYLFIDSSIFRRYHFDTWSGVFETICRLCSDKVMCNFTTDITINELHANISEYAEEVSKYLAKVNKCIGHTAIYKKHGFDEINQGIIEQELWHSLIDFYRLSETEFVGMPDNVTKDVFKKYFEKTPPFGEKKKKHEFPDAFVIESLQSKAISLGKVIFVVSDDPDYNELEKHYDRLKSFSNIEEVLDICIRGIIEKSNTLNDEDIERWIDENSITIEIEVKDKIGDVSFSVNDVGGEIEDVFCSDVKINRKYIIDISEDEITVSLNLTCTINFDVSYDNPERALFRNGEEEEEEETRREKNITQDFNVDCELKLNYDSDSGELDLSELELELFDDTIKIL